MFYISI